MLKNIFLLAQETKDQIRLPSARKPAIKEETMKLKQKNEFNNNNEGHQKKREEVSWLVEKEVVPVVSKKECVDSQAYRQEARIIDL